MAVKFDDDDDDREVEAEAEEDDDAEVAVEEEPVKDDEKSKEDDLEDRSRAVNNAYTGMLAISLLALIIGCVLLFLDYSQYPSGDPKDLKDAPTSLK